MIRCYGVLPASRKTCQTTPLPKQIFVDVSAIIQNDLKTGMYKGCERLIELIKAPPGYRVEPVYLTDKRLLALFVCSALYLRAWVAPLKNGWFVAPESCFVDDQLESQPGDVMAVLDLTERHGR
jgi:hypothetical protein